MRSNERGVAAIMAAAAAAAAVIIMNGEGIATEVSAFTMPQSTSSSLNTRTCPQSQASSSPSTMSGSVFASASRHRSSSIDRTTRLSMSMMTTPPEIVSSGIAVASSALLAVSSSADTIISSPLFTFFAERVIESAIPALFSIIVIFFFFAQFKGARGDAERNEEEAENINAVADLYNDLYGSTRGNGIMNRGRSGGFGRGFQPPPLPKNLGLPKREYIKMTSLNELYSSYDYSVRQATTSKAQAASIFRRQSFDRALNLALNADPGPGDGTASDGTLSGAAKARLLEAEKVFLKEGKSLVQEIQKCESSLAQMTMDDALSKLSAEEQKNVRTKDSVVDAEIVSNDATANESASPANTTTPAFLSKPAFSSQKKKQDDILNKIANDQKKLKKLELTFIEKVIGIVGTKRGFGLRNALLGDIAIRGTGSLLLQLEDRPLSIILNAGNSEDTVNEAGSSSGGKSLFVMRFPGDVQASQLNELREEVTAIARNSKPGDEALVVLQSGGGTVTGYGLAAGQLVRLKEKGLKLTIAVEQVAASGGYMMSCVADKIVASPFAVLGSIGVISEIPNFYERLKDEGIEFQTVTAGKFKRTLTPTKKVTREDRLKSKEDIESIFQLFKGWVAQNRPQLNIEEVATGETWFGPDALERGLCDEIKTVDDILLDYVDGGYSVYEVAYAPPPDVPPSLEFLFANEDGFPLSFTGSRRGGTGAGNNDNSLARRAIRWLVQSFTEEVQGVFVDQSLSSRDRYMARDDSSDRIRVSDEDFW